MHIDFESSRLAEKERYFREFSVWPLYSELDSDNWLSNFLPNEKKIAERLLTNFCYFNESMTQALLKASVQSYFSAAANEDYSINYTINRFIQETAFITSEGEKPRPTDSGHIFARILRDKFDIPDEQIFWPGTAINQLSKFKRFVFVDDFTGSGNQFIDTWEAKHNVNGKLLSFSELSSQPGLSFAYCCCLSTKKARINIKENAAVVALLSAHQLTEENSVVSPVSRVWEGIDANTAIQVIKDASARAGYDAENCGQNDWRGFHCLGLAIAFNHGIPDASLPLFFSQRNGWKPLKMRQDHA